MPRRRALRAIATVFSVTLLAACGDDGGETGPVQVVDALSPYKGHPITIVYSHPAGERGKPYQCNENNDVPKVVKNLASLDKVKVRYLCTSVTEDRREAVYVDARAKEIEHFLFKLRAEGIPARNIFLMGHLEGGWVSLIAARRYGRYFNAAIVFAPAFHGTRDRWAGMGDRRARKARVPRGHAQQITELSNGPLRAFVYVFAEDTYNGPDQLNFLKHVPGVRYVVSKKCKQGVKSAFTDCFADWEKNRLRNYIKKQLAGAQVAKTVN